jgi:hypothetical protein
LGINSTEIIKEKKKIKSFLWDNFSIEGDKGSGAGKNLLVTICKPFYY